MPQEYRAALQDGEEIGRSYAKGGGLTGLKRTALNYAFSGVIEALIPAGADAIEYHIVEFDLDNSQVCELYHAAVQHAPDAAANLKTLKLYIDNKK